MAPWQRVGVIVRRPLILTGLLLMTVGVPEVIIGHTKAASYRAELESLPAPRRESDPTRLYPTLTDADEKRAVIEAKVGYYELLRSAGRLLVLGGLAVIAIGLLRERRPGVTATRHHEFPS